MRVWKGTETRRFRNFWEQKIEWRLKISELTMLLVTKKKKEFVRYGLNPP